MSNPGGVDSIGVPVWLREPVERAWRESPVVVRAFVLLAFVDVVSRSLGILQPRYAVGLDLFGLYAMLIPHGLWILLPAVLVLRRPDAARATPLVFAGAVTIALVTAFERPVGSWLQGPVELSSLAVEVGVLATIAKLVAWLLLARGLALLNPARPSPSVAGLSNLVLGFGLFAAFVGFGRDLLSVPETGIPGLGGLLVLSNVVFAAQLVAWSYLLWIVIRGVGDSRRPWMATTLAAVGAALTGLLDGMTTLAGVVMTSLQSPVPLGGGVGLADLSYALGFVSIGVGQALIVVAFALGLAEPPIPYLVPEPARTEGAPTGPLLEGRAEAGADVGGEAVADAEARAST